MAAIVRRPRHEHPRLGKVARSKPTWLLAPLATPNWRSRCRKTSRGLQEVLKGSCCLPQQTCWKLVVSPQTTAEPAWIWTLLIEVRDECKIAEAFFATPFKTAKFLKGFHLPGACAFDLRCGGEGPQLPRLRRRSRTLAACRYDPRDRKIPLKLPSRTRRYVEW